MEWLEKVPNRMYCASADSVDSRAQNKPYKLHIDIASMVDQKWHRTNKLLSFQIQAICPHILAIDVQRLHTDALIH